MSSRYPVVPRLKVYHGVLRGTTGKGLEGPVQFLLTNLGPGCRMIMLVLAHHGNEARVTQGAVQMPKKRYYFTIDGPARLEISWHVSAQNLEYSQAAEIIEKSLDFYF